MNSVFICSTEVITKLSTTITNLQNIMLIDLLERETKENFTNIQYYLQFNCIDISQQGHNEAEAKYSVYSEFFSLKFSNNPFHDVLLSILNAYTKGNIVNISPLNIYKNFNGHSTSISIIYKLVTCIWVVVLHVSDT
jgi:hypothetical protein